MVGSSSYLKMRSEGGDSIQSDFNDLGNAAQNLFTHALLLGSDFGFGTTFLAWAASIAAIYLLVLDRTNWKTKMLTTLLIPYIFLSLPPVIFNLFRGQVGRWIAFVAVVLQLFFPKHFKEWLELPCALVLLIVVAPTFLASTLRSSIFGVAICLAIGCYLLQEHIRACGGFRNCFSRANGIFNILGILILLVYPAWTIIIDIL